MSAATFGKIPDADCSVGIAADEFALVRMDDDIIDSSFVHVIALLAACARVPDFHSPILRAGDHPLSFAMESNTGDISAMALKGHHRVGVGGLDVEQFDMMTSRCGKEALVGGDTKTVHLRLGMLDVAGANSGEGLPKAAIRLSV